MNQKDLVKLTQKKYRREMGLCIVEGDKLVAEHKHHAVGIFHEPKLSYLENGSGVLAVVPIPTATRVTFPYLVLDNVQDPGNVGTLIRTARAFGFDTIFSINSADVWSQKVIRAAAGTQFGMQIYECNFAEFKILYDTHLAHSKLLVADAPEKTPVANATPPLKKGAVSSLDPAPFLKGGDPQGSGVFGLVLGNEGQGVGPEMRALPHEIVSIPMASGVESLNVAVAGGIIMARFSGCMK